MKSVSTGSRVIQKKLDIVFVNQDQQLKKLRSNLFQSHCVAVPDEIVSVSWLLIVR